MKKVLGSTIIVIALLAGGIIFLVRGCLSKYDERSAISPSLYFEQNNKQLLFSIVKFEKAISYSQNGGFTTKSVNVTYSIQTNDALTGKKIQEKKLKSQEQTKRQPIELISGINGKAFLFMGELMVFNPFNLEQIADQAKLEILNPQLKNRFPADRKYYEFHEADSSFYITMKDGSRWELNMNSLLLSAADESVKSSKSKTILALESEAKATEQMGRSIVEESVRPLTELLYQKKITLTEYNVRVKVFTLRRNQLSNKQDSLRRELSNAERIERQIQQAQQLISNLQNTHIGYFSQAKLNMDTMNGRWYGLYSSEEIAALPNYFQEQPAYLDPARRRFYSGAFSKNENGTLKIDPPTAVGSTTSFFLNGGFLLNKKTGKPILLRDDLSYLIISKNEVGNEGKIVVSRMSLTGEIIWLYNTGLKEWNHWIISKDRLIIFGTDNKELSSGSTNAILPIDLATGHASRYDFFTDK